MADEVPKPDFDWPFLAKDLGPGTKEELRAKFQLQMVGDIYRTMQARLDGFRNSSAAIFTGIVAATITLDAAYIKLVLDSGPTPGHLAWLLLASALICLVGAFIIRQIGGYFAEMTSIVYKIELASKVWTPGAWLPNQVLYPRSFHKSTPVGIAVEDKNASLQGWPDPVIQWFWRLALTFCFIHVLSFAIKSELLARLRQWL